MHLLSPLGVGIVPVTSKAATLTFFWSFKSIYKEAFVRCLEHITAALKRWNRKIFSAFASLFLTPGNHERLSSVFRLLFTEASHRSNGLTRTLSQKLSPVPCSGSRLGWNPSMRRSSATPRRASALVGATSLPWTTGSRWASGRVRKRGRGAGVVGYAWRAHGQTNCASVCPEQRGEWAPSSSRLTQGSACFGEAAATRSAPRPQPCGSDSAAAVCVYCQVRSSYPWGAGGWEGLAAGTEAQGKAGPRKELA